MAKGSRRERLGSALSGVLLEIAPQTAAIAAFLAGALVLASAATPAIRERLALMHAAPVFLIEFSHFAASIIGLLLMLVGSGLWRRREGAFWFALYLLLAGAVLSLTKGLEYGVSILLLLVALLLWTARTSFDRPSRLRAGVGPVWLAATIAAVVASAELGVIAYRELPYSDELWWTFLRDGDVARTLRAGVAVAVITLIVAVVTLLSPPRRRDSRSGPEDLARVEAIIAADPNASASAAILLLGDKEFFFSESGRSVIAFRQRASRWIALGPPLGPVEERAALMWRFVEVADRFGANAVFYAAPAGLLPQLAAMGFLIRQVGEEAVVHAAAFSISGKGKQNLRTACNKASAEGCVFEVLPPGSAGGLAGELKTISDAWLKEHAGAEKSFSMGRFDIGFLDRSPLALIRREGRIIAFANILVAEKASQVKVDLMRYVEPCPHGIMDYLLTRVIQWAGEAGYREVSLGMAPLSGLENRRLAPLFARLGALVYAEAGAFYSFGGLHAYKQKFGPEWRPMYMAGRPGTIMPLALLDVALLTGGGWRGVFLKG